MSSAGKGSRPGIRRSLLPAIYRKALRDLWLLRGQALAIMGVVLAGIAMLTMMQIAYHSLLFSRDNMFAVQNGNMPDVWVNLKRAPESVAQQVAALPDVVEIDTRILAAGKLKLPQLEEPLQAQLVSLPDDGSQPVQNRVFLKSGRMPSPHVRDEVVVSDAFAQFHHLQPGARLRVTINGRSQWFRMVGAGTTAEYLYQLAPGGIFPDYEHFAILWAPREALAAAMNMDGAFNALTARLSPQADPLGRQARAIAGIDRVLDRWGGLGAIGRDDQISARRLKDELGQLQTNTRLLPSIFLGVAAFLLHVVFTRLVGMQRGQIAILKAFGYRTRTVMMHYGLMASLICVVGALLGVLAGSWMGHWMAVIYLQNFRFPQMHFAMDVQTVGGGVLVAVLAGVAGAGQAVLRAVREPVAQAMRPQAPERFRAGGLERLRFVKRLPQAARMVLRQLERRPGRAALTVVGLAMAGALIVVVRLQGGALTYLVDSRFRLGELYDIAATFTEKQPRRALHELQSIPGVQYAEPTRAVPVQIQAQNRRLRTVVEGLPPDGTLRRLVDERLVPQTLPDYGLVINDYLAARFGVSVGDTLLVRELQGRRRTLQLPVSALISEQIGVTAYMSVDAMNRVLGDGDVLEGVVMDVEPGQLQAVKLALDRRPEVATISVRKDSTDSFFQLLERITGPVTTMGVLMGILVNFGVVYNSVRITLAERARELSSLRVLGFTRAEVARILLGEIGLLVLLSIPLSFVCGWGLGWLMVQGLQSDVYRIPMRIPPEGYALAALVTVSSTLLSMAAVLRLVNRLDMIEALKERE